MKHTYLVAGGVPLAALALLSIGCAPSGGSSGPTRVVGFEFQSSSDSEANPAVVQVKLTTSLPVLDAPLTVDVSDAGTGTASSGVDYTAFATQQLTFPAGSPSGTLLPVTILVLDDSSIEGADETVVLALSNVSGGKLGSKTLHTATIEEDDLASFAFTAPTTVTPDEAAATFPMTVQLTVPPGKTLDTAVSVQVGDAGTGSASSASDYTAFATQQLSFPAGTLTGTTQGYTLDVLQDLVVEVDETVVIGLSQPSPGAQLGATPTHEITITDDDVSNDPWLVVTTGPGGDGTYLAHTDLVDLGAQQLNAGPNAGALVKLANAGVNAMQLDPPLLAGGSPNDFSLTYQLAAPLPPAGQYYEPVSFAPVAEDALEGCQVPLPVPDLVAFAAERNLTVVDFPQPGGGTLALELQRLPSPWRANSRLYVDGELVERAPESADLSLWKGHVVGDPDSTVFLGLSPLGSNGFVQLGDGLGTMLHVIPDQEDPMTGLPAGVRVVNEEQLTALGVQRIADYCGTAPPVEPPLVPGAGAGSLASNPGPLALTLTDCRMAIETDFQLYQIFGSVPATDNYVTQMMAAISDRYVTDVQTTLSISQLNIYSTAGDPWTSQDTGGDALDLLNEFRAALSGANYPANSDLAHFISGANLGGGVAYLDVLCNNSFGFGVSGNINGNINWGAWTGQPAGFTWDFVVVAHEMGHNFGSPHTHDYCPAPLDRCSPGGFFGACQGQQVCGQGTIMSYCHLCAGGMNNITLEFHSVVADRIRTEINGSCLGAASLDGGDEVIFSVHFDPITSTGTKNATLSWSHDAVNTSTPFRLNLTGTASN